MNTKTFDEWKREVDEVLWRTTGLDSEGAPDWGYLRAWQDGKSPRTAAAEAVKAGKKF